VKVKQGDRELLTTQLFIRDFSGNDKDFVFKQMRDPVDRELVLVDFKPVAESKVGELAASFDIVIGQTPKETSQGPGRKVLR
jgi:protocatechuate 3,4-dioxygenase beta subunit